MLQTMGGNPRNFQELNLYSLPSPCFVIDKKALRTNLKVLQRLKLETNVKILVALKAFSAPSLAPLISQYLDGCCSSGLYESRLAAKYFRGEISTFSPAFKKSEFNEIADISDHIIFNSLSQLNDFYDIAHNLKKEVGIRINPLYSEIENPKYNSASKYSRLGIHLNDLKEIDLDKIDGIHFHTLCEQNFQPLQNTWDQIKNIIIPISKKLRWINLGGGHHITREDYELSKLKSFLKKISDETNCQIYVEPGEAVVLDSGILIGEIVDLFKPNNNLSPHIAITDISATSHIPDVIEAPYRPALLNEPKEGYDVVLGGPSCLASDVIGKYKFKKLPLIGDRIALLDQAHYTMVKTSFFNGVKLPSIALWDSDTDVINIIKKFSFKDFENKL
ncbi:carboxynorspermidine decarboxylase [Alphaproteobacteria bacterium]|nr:carboxynorspermidine decarboxylase [Alphaproteobacteria bacterium]MDC1022945.1 carboxynorspermidine decarboxylase [Alphaproteobacteria bacterium]